MTMSCDEMHLLIQADIDGELTPSESARVAAHLAGCPDCARVQIQLLALSGRIRSAIPRAVASDTLRARVSALAPAPHRGAARRFTRLAPFTAGFALAACLALAIVLPHGGDALTDNLVSSHLRALQPGHLMDVVSTDQHTVKPWFDGRLPFAPPVRDFKEQGFPLTGGRLDVIAGHPVAALIYQRRQHIIDVYVWPETGLSSVAPAESSGSGYHVEGWHRDGLAFWAVSDVGAEDLSDFVRLWRAPAPE